MKHPVQHFRKKRRDRHRSLSIREKMIQNMVIFILVTVIVLTSIFAAVFTNQVFEANQSDTEHQINNTLKSLNSYLTELSSLATECNYNYYLQQYLYEERNNQKGYLSLISGYNMRSYELASDAFGTWLNDRSDVTAVYVFGKYSLLLQKTSQYNLYSIGNFKEEDWYREAIKKPYRTVYSGPSTHDFLLQENSEKLSVSHAIQSSEDGTMIGVVLIDFNLNQIEKIFSSIETADGQEIFLSDSEGEVISSTGTLHQQNHKDAVLKKKISEIASGKKKTGISRVKTDSGTYDLYSKNVDGTDWTLISVQNHHNVVQEIQKYLIPVLILAIALLVGMCVLIWFGIGRSVGPLTSLQKKMESMSLDHLEKMEPSPNKDEVGVLIDSFNKMIDRIDNLTNQVIEEQEEKRKYELSALQAQINPHFLYNTLDSIIWMAEMNDHDVVPMTEALAKLMRLSINKGRTLTTVKSEMEHVHNYLIIQHFRYGDKFDYSIDAADEIKDCVIIRLIVQPIVENSIYHGIKPKDGKGHIDVSAYEDGDDLVIRVRDDGVGMTEEECSGILLNHKVSKASGGSGIGVKNVNERIQLSYGSEYGVHYESELGVGTTAFIRMPKQFTDPESGEEGDCHEE